MLAMEYVSLFTSKSISGDLKYLCKILIRFILKKTSPLDLWMIIKIFLIFFKILI